jgi:hypothetical protein
MSPPNIFHFAKKELSQDAFICWLASWAKPELCKLDEALHATAIKFLDALIRCGGGPEVVEYKSIEVCRQFKQIDVLLLINGEIAVIIEDKINAIDHSNQLRRYKERIEKKFPKNAAVYFKTGDQCEYENARQAGYGCFLRKHLLSILESGIQLGVRNDIFMAFHCHLRDIEDTVRSYSAVPCQEWKKNHLIWRGFFMALQERLGATDWNYDGHPGGQSLSFRWHWIDNKYYLHLEGSKLRFKIAVEAESQRFGEWTKLKQGLMIQKELDGVRIQLFRSGKRMTVGFLDLDYRQVDKQGLLDMDRTVDVLRAAERAMDAALTSH